MRKINTVLTLLVMLLLLDHMIFGGFYLFGIGNGVIAILAGSMLVLILLHALISMAVTIRAEIVGFKTKARYNKENREFWQRRVSGMFILVLGLVHVFMTGKNEQGIPRIAFLPKIFYAANPALICFIYWHILSNIRPLLISLGIRNIDNKQRIIKIVLTVVTLFALIANLQVIVSHMGGH